MENCHIEEPEEFERFGPAPTVNTWKRTMNPSTPEQVVAFRAFLAAKGVKVPRLCSACGKLECTCCEVCNEPPSLCLCSQRCQDCGKVPCECEQDPWVDDGYDDVVVESE